jgi:leader peptidase (prepilin peptidase)/N-methyltransferase
MPTILPASPTLLALAGLLGLALGSFASCAVYRYVADLSMLRPLRSFCPECAHPLAWWENIPLLSFLVLRGRCHHCKAPISLRYPLIELLMATWTAAVAWRYGFSPQWLALTAFGLLFIVASFIDFAIFILPDMLTLPGAVLAFPVAVWVLGVSWDMSLLGAAVGAGLFWTIQILYRAIRKQEGLGLGDVKLMLLIGALTGAKALPLVITVGAFSGLAASVIYILRPGGKGLKTRIPFGPFLSLGAMIYLLFGRGLV